MVTTLKLGNLIENGYITELDTVPNKCTYCKGGDLVEVGHIYEGSHFDQVIEFSKVCCGCEKLNGIWSNGTWFI